MIICCFISEAVYLKLFVPSSRIDVDYNSTVSEIRVDEAYSLFTTGGKDIAEICIESDVHIGSIFSILMARREQVLGVVLSSANRAKFLVFTLNNALNNRSHQIFILYQVVLAPLPKSVALLR